MRRLYGAGLVVALATMAMSGCAGRVTDTMAQLRSNAVFYAPTGTSVLRYKTSVDGYATVFLVQPDVGVRVLYASEYDSQEPQRAGAYSPSAIGLDVLSDPSWLDKQYISPDSYMYLVVSKEPLRVREVEYMLRNITEPKLGFDGVVWDLTHALEDTKNPFVAQAAYHLWSVRQIIDAVHPGCLDAGRRAALHGSGIECQRTQGIASN